MIRRALGVLLAIVIALAGVIALLLVLQSRDHGSLDRPAVTQTHTQTVP